MLGVGRPHIVSVYRAFISLFVAFYNNQMKSVVFVPVKVTERQVKLEFSVLVELYACWTRFCRNRSVERDLSAAF